MHESISQKGRPNGAAFLDAKKTMKAVTLILMLAVVPV